LHASFLNSQIVSVSGSQLLHAGHCWRPTLTPIAQPLLLCHMHLSDSEWTAGRGEEREEQEWWGVGKGKGEDICRERI